MIDTVITFNPLELQISNPPAGWSHVRRTGSFRRLPRQTFDYDDPSTGFHVHGTGNEIRYQRASLARLLHRGNGCLIKNQQELDRALELFHGHSDLLGSFRGPEHFTRVDLVWQFAGYPVRFIQAHRASRHPRIHKDPVLFSSRSIAWKGSALRITIYDKVFERHRRPGNVIRVEVQIRGDLLKSLLGSNDKVTSLEFSACYQAYRSVLLGFQPVSVPNVSSIGQFLAVGEREGWQAAGIPAFDLYTQGLSSRQSNRLRKEMALLRQDHWHIDWNQLLPADHPPDPIEVE